MGNRLKNSQNLLLACCLLAVMILFPAVLSAQTEQDRGKIRISAREISEIKAVRMADILNRVPGVKAGETTVSIHGNYKVKVLLDGRPINDPTSSVNGVRWDLVSLENIDKIEILKGRGALEYGDDATGGVILISSRQADRLSGNLKGYGGNQSTAELSVNTSVAARNFGISASGAWYQTEGYKVNNDKKRRRAGTKLSYTLDGDIDLTLSADVSRQEKGLSGTAAFPTPYSRQISDMASVSLAGKKGNNRLNAFFNEGKKHHTDASRDLDNLLRVRNSGLETATQVSFEHKGRLAAGSTLTWDQASGTTLADEKDESGAALFIVYSLKWPSLPLSVSTGVRGNLYSNFDNTINPEIKLSWQQGEFQAQGAYSRSNNLPSFYQRYARTSSKRISPDLTTETSDNFSLTLSHPLHKTVTLASTLFYNRLEDRITYVRSNDGTGKYQNIGKASYKGFDLSLNWNIHRRAALTSAYTYLEAKNETTGLWLTAKPRHKALLELSLTPIDRLSIITGAAFCGQVYNSTDNEKIISGYAIYHMRAEYTLGAFSLFTQINNASDTDYLYADGHTAPPRTWLLGTNWRF